MSLKCPLDAKDLHAPLCFSQSLMWLVHIAPTHLVITMEDREVRWSGGKPYLLKHSNIIRGTHQVKSFSYISFILFILIFVFSFLLLLLKMEKISTTLQ